MAVVVLIAETGIRLLLESGIGVGRDPESNDLVFDSDRVSKNHARVVHADGQVRVVDLNSQHGTYVNEERVDGLSSLVREGDIIKIGGRHRLRWETHRPGENDVEVHPNGFVAKHPRERELLAAIADDPTNDELREVYRDWLEDQGDRALEVQFLVAENRPDMSDSLREAALRLSLEWRVTVSRGRIENCQRKRCPRKWNALTSTVAVEKRPPTTRTCQVCTKPVYYVPTMALAGWHGRRSHAVVVDPVLRRAPDDLRASPKWSNRARRDPAELIAAQSASATSFGAPAPAQLLALPFFQKLRPPESIGELVESLRLRVADALEPGDEKGTFFGPRPTGSDFVKACVARYETEKRPFWFKDIASAPMTMFRIELHADRGVLDTWLRERYLEPRVVRVLMKGDRQREHRVYDDGHLIVSDDHDDHSILEWWNKLPDFALPPTNAEAAYRFLTEMAMASPHDLPPVPSDAGVTYNPLSGPRIEIVLEPMLPLVRVLEALGLEQDAVVGYTADLDLATWFVGRVVTEGLIFRKKVVRRPGIGHWTTIELPILAPAGVWLPGLGCAAKSLSPNDRIGRIIFERR